MTEMVGQENILSQMRAAAREGRISHAYLLCGPEGGGKRTLARALAGIFMCPRGGEDDCADCRKAASGVHPDIITVCGETKKTGAFPIDQIRALRRDVFVMPNEGKRKIYIMEDVHKMTPEAQDAFLKVLEEPPAYAVFLMTTSREDKLLSTILSRVVRIRVPLPEKAEAARYLAALGFDPGEAETALGLCGGAIGGARALLESGTLPEKIALCERFCDCLIRGTPYDLAALVHSVAADRETLAAFLGLQQTYFRDILYLKKTGKTDALVFRGSVTANEARYSRMKESGIAAVIEKTEHLRRLCAAPISLVLLETRVVTLCGEEIF